jgi:leader peptidase (prepilin peptidase)/N-methyltransferase
MGESDGLLTGSLAPLGVIAAALFGAVWGSFFNVCIARVPLGQSVVRPGSRCDACGAPVRAADNIPLLSYLLLRGRCRACQAPIGALTPLVEVLSAALAAALWWRLVAADPVTATGIRAARFAFAFAFAGVLIVLSFIDLRTKRLPDKITLPAIAVFLLAGFGTHDVPWLERVIGVVAGYLVFRLPADFYYYVLKREGLGLGDAKLLAMIGAALGWKALPFVIFVGGFFGAVVSIPFAIRARQSLRETQVPFGPFLAAAALVYLFAGPAILRLWLGAGDAG